MFDFSLNGSEAIFDIEKFELTNKGQIERLNSNVVNEEIKTAYLKLNDACNLNCIYCFQRYDSKKAKKIDIKMYKELMLQIIEEFDHIVLFGGEPLLKVNMECLDYIFNMCSKHTVSMFTNGCFKEEELELLSSVKEKINILIISMDGPMKIHDSRRVLFNGSSYDLIIGNLHKLLRNNIPFYIQINVDRSNINYIEELIETLINEFGEKKFPISLNKVLHSEDGISEIEFLKKYVEVRKKITNSYIFPNSKVYQKLQSILKNHGCIAKRCDIGNNFVFDFINNTIYSCPQENSTHIGSFDYGSMNIDEMNQKNMIDYSNKRIEGCEDCLYKCFCTYGCYIERDLLGESCKTKTQECIRYILDNYNYFFK